MKQENVKTRSIFSNDANACKPLLWLKSIFCIQPGPVAAHTMFILAVHVKKLLHTRKWDDGVWERSGKKMAKECNHRISSCSFVMWRFNTMSGGESVGSTRRVEVERQFVEITFFPRPLYPETLYAAAVAAANVRYYWGSYRNHHFRSGDGKKSSFELILWWCGSMLTCDTFQIAPSWQSKRKNDTAAAQNDQMTAIKVAVRSSNSSNIEWMLWVTLVHFSSILSFYSVSCVTLICEKSGRSQSVH